MPPSIENISHAQVDGDYVPHEKDIFDQAEVHRPDSTQREIVDGSHPAESKKAPKTVQQQFDIDGRVYLVTGGGQGLGLSMAEGLVEGGGIVYCLDQREIPDDEFYAVQKATKTLASRGVSNPGSLHYRQVDVRDTDALERVTASIVSTHNRIDGLVAAAAIQQITPAVEYTVNDVCRMIDVNFTGTFMSATAVARKMMDHKFNGSIVLVASMSGFVANKGLLSPVYNSSKAALIQLARNLAMEWGKHGIRVNSLCPGHVITPMVERNFEEAPGLKETWEAESMLGRLSLPEEFKGAALFLCSPASSYMTGSAMIVDGGHTAW